VTTACPRGATADRVAAVETCRRAVTAGLDATTNERYEQFLTAAPISVLRASIRTPRRTTPLSLLDHEGGCATVVACQVKIADVDVAVLHGRHRGHDRRSGADDLHDVVDHEEQRAAPAAAPLLWP